MSWPVRILLGAFMALVFYGAGRSFLQLWLEYRESRRIRDLPPGLRAILETDFPDWCANCRLTALVCDLHPSKPYEECGCEDGLPRPCPSCEEYDVLGLLEEIAELRTRVATGGQRNGSAP